MTYLKTALGGFAAAVVIGISLLAGPASAGPGNLDLTYGKQGFAAFPDDFVHASIADVVAQRKSKLVVAGTSDDGDYPLLAELDGRGRMERRFGRNGTVDEFPWANEDTGRYGHTFWALAPLEDGFLATAFDRRGSVVAKYRRNGSLEPSFGSFPGYSFTSPYQAIAGTSRNRMVLVGFLGSIQLRNADGALSKSFGRRGQSTFNRRATSCRRILRTALEAVEVDSRNRIVVGGTVDTCSHGTYTSRSFVGRLRPDGHRDRSFGDNGSGMAIGPEGFLTDLKIAADDAPVAALTRLVRGKPGKSRALLMKLRPDGSRDPDFAGDGVLVQKDNRGFSSSLELRHRRIVSVTALHRTAWTYDPLVSRFRFNGQIDQSYGRHGRTRIPNLHLESSAGTAIDEKGRLYVSGFRGTLSNPRPAVVRLR